MSKLNLKFLAVAALAVAFVACVVPDATQQAVASFAPVVGDWSRAEWLINSGALFGIGMTTLAANSPRAYEQGLLGHLPVIASDIIYEGAAVGVVDASGHARPLVGGDKFSGFATRKADNSAGAAAAINVEVQRRGQVQLSVSGAVITDVGQPVYATDDDTFVFNPVGGSFIGFVKRFVSSGIVVVGFDLDAMADPYGDWPIRETLAGTKTFDAQDCGKAFFCTAAADGDALTLPSIADGLHDILIVAIDAYGTTQIKIDPAAADSIRAADLAAVDNKDLLLTKATQRRGDSARIALGDADGYSASIKGTWTAEA